MCVGGAEVVEGGVAKGDLGSLVAGRRNGEVERRCRVADDDSERVADFAFVVCDAGGHGVAAVVGVDVSPCQRSGESFSGSGRERCFCHGRWFDRCAVAPVDRCGVGIGGARVVEARGEEFDGGALCRHPIFVDRDRRCGVGDRHAEYVAPGGLVIIGDTDGDAVVAVVGVEVFGDWDGGEDDVSGSGEIPHVSGFKWRAVAPVDPDHVGVGGASVGNDRRIEGDSNTFDVQWLVGAGVDLWWNIADRHRSRRLVRSAIECVDDIDGDVVAAVVREVVFDDCGDDGLVCLLGGACVRRRAR